MLLCVQLSLTHSHNLKYSAFILHCLNDFVHVDMRTNGSAQSLLKTTTMKTSTMIPSTMKTSTFLFDTLTGKNILSKVFIYRKESFPFPPLTIINSIMRIIDQNEHQDSHRLKDHATIDIVS